jgi:iron complex outermembrane recepter protein
MGRIYSVPVAAGNRVAGTQRGSAFVEMAWAGGAWGDMALEWRAAARTAVNDTNGEFAAGHGTVSLRWSKRYALSSTVSAEWLARVDNLADRRHVGSVIVNDANGRFYEPAAPRSVLLALRLIAKP